MGVHGLLFGPRRRPPTRGHERARASYRGNCGWLAQIKAAYVYDPRSLFRANQNIQPKA
jgi:hypothetical protein